MTALRSLLLAFVVVALGAAGLAARAAESGPAVGAVTAVKGTVFRESEGGKRAPVAAGAAVFKADVIVAEAAGKARIHLNDGSILSVGEGARLRIADYQSTTNGYTTRIEAAGGPLRIFVRGVLPSGRFEVESDTAVAAVRGTDFVVEVTPERTSVALLDGRVAARGTGANAGSEVVLQQAGQGTDVPRGGPPSPVTTWGAQRFATTVARASFD
jgi:hypothetical protein